ncbi:MAG: beta-lactamase family protein, partial [Chloroflexi bacterium]|nr:beta-lactamase family protein [Chloroflexota bacterium]
NEQILQWKKNVYSFPPIGTPDSRAYVTATDLDRFLRAVKSGKLLSPDQAQAFFTPQVHYRRMKTGWDMFYGLGMWFYVDPGGQVVCSEKEGSKPGASSLIRHFPNHDINLVIWRTWKMPPRILPGISMIWSSLAVWINRLSN